MASLSDWKIGQMLCAPMLWKGQPIGVLLLSRGGDGSFYRQADLDLLLAVAQCAAMAVAGQQIQDELKQHEGDLTAFVLHDLREPSS